MRALLDVNVLIALLDQQHADHATAVSWMDREGDHGWASCPITQNGCLRVMSQPGYPNPVSVTEIADRLRAATQASWHEFWPDDVSLLDSEISINRIHGPRQVTDIYLFYLAIRHGGRFATFDRRAGVGAIPRASEEHLVVLEG